ncbi:MAG: DUF4376 domain-containing protein [Candidatus Oceanisphaera merdipullorum]|nr:DUF4376 domain-containing protein [Candidatus Oceanisphaera merdipullorum]
MKIYCYHPHTGEYTSQSVADMDPLVPDGWLIPAYATATKPPAVGQGKAAVWKNKQWHVLDDYRDTVVYDKQSREQRLITEFGPIPDSHTSLTPHFDSVWVGTHWQLDPEAITRHKVAKTVLINQWRDQQERENLQFDHAGHNWDGGIDSKSRMDETLALATATGGLPDGFFWTTANNMDVPMDLAALQALASALAAARGLRGFEIHARQRQMKAEVEALPSIAAVQEYVIAWPEAVNV